MATAPAPKDQATSISNALIAKVEYEIRLEEGKSTGQFLSIKKGLKPCKKSPDSCADTIRPLVDESYVKFNRGIIATILLQNNGAFDVNMFNQVKNSLLLPTLNDYERLRVANLSPVGREIMNENKISDEDKTELFKIWYLRQVPYAGEDIWKNSNSNYNWNYYLELADQYLYRVQ